jgi:hypothetical protein
MAALLIECKGIGLQDIIQHITDEDRQKTLTFGYQKLIGNSIGSLGHTISHNRHRIWPPQSDI